MDMDREHLIHAYLEGVASPEEVREVNRLVQEDPVFRRDLLAEGALQAGLGTNMIWAADIFRFRQLFLRARLLRPLLSAAAAVLVLGFGLVLYIGNIKPITVVIARSPVSIERPLTLDTVKAPTAPVPELVARVSRVRGIVSIDGSDSREWSRVCENSPIALGYTLVVASNSQVEVTYEDGSKLVLYSSTRLTFEPSVNGKLLRLVTGCVDANVAVQPVEEPMRVYTEQLTVQVKGTEFRTIAQGGKTWVAVKAGSVKVFRHSDGRKAEVAAGRYVVDGIKKWPFAAIPTSCPIWKGECMAVAGNPYP